MDTKKQFHLSVSLPMDNGWQVHLLTPQQGSGRLKMAISTPHLWAILGGYLMWLGPLILPYYVPRLTTLQLLSGARNQEQILEI